MPRSTAALLSAPLLCHTTSSWTQVSRVCVSTAKRRVLRRTSGSSDLWIVGSNVGGGACNTQNQCSPAFSPSASSSFQDSNTKFQVQYGSGDALGSLGKDTLQMAGFQVSGQTFAVASQVDGGIVQFPVSGLMGLAWQSLASSGAVPFWQSLAQSGAWDAPLMAFQLTRFRGSNKQTVDDIAPGGTFTMGFTNSTLFTGNIEYTDVVGTPSYWTLPMTTVTVNGVAVSLPGGSSANSAAIDTGTTLIAGPTAAVQAIYAQIPGAHSIVFQGQQGYFGFPCSTTVKIALAFGGATTWAIDPKDFNNGPVDSSGTCLGAFFAIDQPSNSATPPWIVGDTFLKNVYSVFRFNPPSVGFAALAAGPLKAIEQGGVPSATIGAVATQVAAANGQANGGGGGGGGIFGNAAAPGAALPPWTTLFALAVGALATAWAV
jgi:cathepsin D